MTDGIVTRMWNDGMVLSITVSKAWMSLSANSQEHLYRALGCLAREKQVVFQITPAWIPERSYSPNMNIREANADSPKRRR